MTSLLIYNVSDFEFLPFYMKDSSCNYLLIFRLVILPSLPSLPIYLHHQAKK